MNYKLIFMKRGNNMTTTVSQLLEVLGKEVSNLSDIDTSNLSNVVAANPNIKNGLERILQGANEVTNVNTKTRKSKVTEHPEYRTTMDLVNDGSITPEKAAQILDCSVVTI